jgi:hypothetical protein
LKLLGVEMYPADYCVVVINEVKSFVQLQFESLVRDMPEAFNLFKSFHIVDKNTKDGVIDYCKNRIPLVNIHKLDYYVPESRTGKAIGSDWQWDFAYSYQYAAENCGDSEWILICHPDIMYMNPKAFFEGLFELISPDIGVLWNVGFLLIRRKAYDQCHIGFWPLFGTVCCFNNADRNNSYLLHIHDERRSLFGEVLSITGLEATDLFFIELQSLGWRSVVIPHRLRDYFDHFSQSTKHEINMSDPLCNKMWEEKVNLVKRYLANYGVR